MYNDVHVQKKHDNTRQYIEIFISNQINSDTFREAWVSSFNDFNSI